MLPQTSTQSSGIKSPFGSGAGSLSLMETVKEKIDNVRHGRKKHKEMSIPQAKLDSTDTEVSQSLVNHEQLTHHLAQFNLNIDKQINNAEVRLFYAFYLT